MRIRILFLVSILGLILYSCNRKGDPDYYLQFDWDIAYYRENDVFRKLYIYYTENDYERLISEDFTSEYNSQWSPDGSSISFFADSIRNSTLSVYDFETDVINPILIIEGDSPLHTWSPDGSKIAVCSKGTDNKSDIQIIDPGGTELQVINDLNHSKYLFWGPFDNSLFYLNWYGKITILDLEEPLLKQVVDNEFSLDELSRSANFEKLVFVNKDNQYPDGIYVSQSSLFDFKLVAESGNEPRLSHDASKIVYINRSIDQETQARISSLFTVSSSGQEKQMVFESINWLMHPNWSADGSKIVFVSVEELSPNAALYHLCIINEDGTGFTVLASASDHRILYPYWRPDIH